MDLQLLKGAMLARNISYRECANWLDISVTSLSSKMNGKSQFTVEEMHVLIDKLGLSLGTVIQIFLPKTLHTVQGDKLVL